MLTVDDYKEKIKKLLALAQSPSEAEAKAALLKARKLMAEYKLTEADLKEAEEQPVKDILTDITCSKRRDPWIVNLSTIIGRNYCCQGYIRRNKHKQTILIGFIGLENDVYFQIGLVMLVGLAAKNAILIVEFAKVQVDKGEDLIQSAIYAARLRFRPILMTSLAFVLGMLPMVLASGPGSASRQAIGTGVFFGMIFAIVFGIILVPFFFVMVYKTKSKILKHKK